MPTYTFEEKDHEDEEDDRGDVDDFSDDFEAIIRGASQRFRLGR